MCTFLRTLVYGMKDRFLFLLTKEKSITLKKLWAKLQFTTTIYQDGQTCSPPRKKRKIKI